MKLNPQFDTYISQFPDSTQEILQTLRKFIQSKLPNSEEVMSYGMPAYKENGVLVFFAGYKNHIGFYPTGKGIEAVAADLQTMGYKWSKGAIQFPINEPLPYDFIEKIIQIRIAQTTK